MPTEPPNSSRGETNLEGLHQQKDRRGLQLQDLEIWALSVKVRTMGILRGVFARATWSYIARTLACRMRVSTTEPTHRTYQLV